jgi:hypothetical protein
MSAPELVKAFYECIWNNGDLDAVSKLLSPNFSFRSSLGNQMRGHEEFKGYVRSVRGALADYHCEILSCASRVVTWRRLEVTNLLERLCSG